MKKLIVVVIIILFGSFTWIGISSDPQVENILDNNALLGTLRILKR